MNNVQSEESAQFGNNNDDSNKNNNINNTEYQKNSFFHTEKEKISIISFLHANYVIDVTHVKAYIIFTSQ